MSAPHGTGPRPPLRALGLAILTVVVTTPGLGGRQLSLAQRAGRLSDLHAPPAAVSAQAQDPRALLAQAIEEFEANRVVESAATFDRLAAAAPQVMPNLWQRGIAQYYAGRYRDCRLQFEAHLTVNAADVENSAWHFLCAAREMNAQQARLLLLPVGPDRRVPMRQVYEMFRGTLAPDAVIAAGSGSLEAQFFAHLYVGLYYEATGDDRRALEHITIAAADRFESAGDYMHLVARVHLAQRKAGPRR